jgi:hypothetical protein
MRCPSCGGQTRKHVLCGKCRADAQRWRRIAERQRKAREREAKQKVRKAA